MPSLQLESEKERLSLTLDLEENGISALQAARDGLQIAGSVYGNMIDLMNHVPLLNSALIRRTAGLDLSNQSSPGGQQIQLVLRIRRNAFHRNPELARFIRFG
jgi:hypothetical protein